MVVSTLSFQHYHEQCCTVYHPALANTIYTIWNAFLHKYTWVNINIKLLLHQTSILSAWLPCYARAYHVL